MIRLKNYDAEFSREAQEKELAIAPCCVCSWFNAAFNSMQVYACNCVLCNVTWSMSI